MVRPFHFTSTCAEPMTWPAGMKRHIDIADAGRLAIGRGLARVRELLAIAGGHGLDRFGRCEHGAVAGARVIRMAVRDDGAINPAAHRVDVEIAWRAIEALRRRVGGDLRGGSWLTYEAWRRVRQILWPHVLQLARSRV